jgi:hypothetical protein
MAAKVAEFSASYWRAFSALPRTVSNSVMSAPAQKSLPAPMRMTARMVESPASPSKRDVMACHIACDMAFLRAGLSIVTGHDAVFGACHVEKLVLRDYVIRHAANPIEHTFRKMRFI